jgi:hypothetical protein
MTAISFGYASRTGKTTIPGAFKVGHFSRGKSRLIDPVQLRDGLRRFGSSAPKEFAGGFVDFLLGRSSRYPR